MQRSVTPFPVDEETSCESIAEGPRGVSVILFEDEAHQEKMISDTRAHFQRHETAVEFIVISADGMRLAPLCETQQTRSVQSLDVAIRCANFDKLAIIDTVYHFDAKHWNIVDPMRREEAFRSWCCRPTRAPRSRRILAWFYCQIIRLLLGGTKNRIAPGLVTFSKSSISNIDLHRLDQHSADSVFQLLAVAKLKGHKIEEHYSNSCQPETEWTKTNSSEPHFPKSKSLKHSIKRNLQFWFCEIAFPARPSKSHHFISPWQHVAASSAIIMLAAFLLLTNSNYPLFEPDETRNAQLALNILDSGNWSSLTLAGEPYWDKPPLLAWLTAASYKCFGISEFSTRLPSIFGSLVLLTFMLVAGSKLMGFRVAALGVAAMLLAWGFMFQARYVTMDALLTLFTTVVTLGIAVGFTSTAPKRIGRWWLIVSGIALGLGVLAKGPICIVLTAPPIVAWLYLNRSVSREVVRAALKLVLVPAVLVAAPWFVLTTIRSPEFAWYFLWTHHVVRFSDAFNHQEPFWYYVPILWLFMFPASILLPRVIHFIVSRKQKYRLFRLPIHGLLAMSAFWIVGFFSVSQCKLPAYVLPAFPLIALLTGVVFNFELARSTDRRSRFDRLPKRIAIGVCVLSLAVSAVTIYQFGNHGAALVLGFAVVVSLALAMFFPLKRSTTRCASWIATVAIGLLFVSLGVNQLVPSIASDRSILKSLCRQHQNRQAVPVVYFGRDSFGSEFYLPDTKVIQFDEEALPHMQEFLSLHPQTTIVASNSNIERVKKTFGSDIIIEEAPGRHIFFASFTPERIASDLRFRRTRK